MAKKWNDVEVSDGFKALPPDQQDVARRQYFDEVVAPQVPQEHRESAWDEFRSFAGVGRRDLPANVPPSTAGGGRGTVNPGAPIQEPRQAPAPSRAQRIAEMDEVTDPTNPNYLPVTDNAVRALQTGARGGMDAKRTRSPGRVLDADIEPITPTGALRDLASGVLQIPGVAVKSASDVARLATGDSFGKGLGDSAEAVNKAIRENVGTWRAQQQATRFQQDMADPNLNAADVVVGNPGALADMALPTVGSMALPVGTAALASKAATSSKAAQVARAIDEATVLDRAAKASSAAVLGTTMAQNAGDTFSEIRDDGGDLGDAYKGAAVTLPFTLAANKLTGGGAEGGIVRAMAGAKGAAKQIPGASLREGSQELGEDAGQYLGETIGKGEEFDINTATKRGAVAFTLGAAVGGGMESVSAARAARESRIQNLRAAGETAAADLLQQKHEQATAAESVEAEISAMPGNQAFAQQYRAMRSTGMKPTEAAARSAATVTFGGIALDAGVPDKAMQAAMTAAQDMPLDKVPGFFQKFTDALLKRGMVQPNDALAQVAQSVEAARDDALEVAILNLERSTEPNAQSQAPGTAPQATTDQAPAATGGNGAAAPVVPGARGATPQAAGVRPEPELTSAIDVAAHSAATSPLNDTPEPTDAQKQAGNYKVGRVTLHGLNISIENPQGSVRSGTSPDGTKWSNTLAAHYGYIRGTEGNDGDHVDTFIGPNPDSQKVFVVDQVNKDGSFDEHKVVLGADSLTQADDLYHANYHAGWTGRGAITEMSMDDFKKWVKDGTKNKPIAQAAAPNAGAAPARPAPQDEPASGGEPAAADDTAAPVGRDFVPLSQGGKPFKTKRAADDARRTNNTMRTIQVEGGYALAPKTDAQLAAQAKAAKRLAQPNVSPPGEPIPAHAFIAAEGGLHADNRSDMAMQGNVRIGNRMLFAGGGRGLTIERATELLVEAGYLPDGAGHDQARDLIKRSLTNPQYTADGFERMADAEVQAQFEDHLAAQAEMSPEDDPFGPLGFEPEDVDASAYQAKNQQLQLEVRALLAMHEDNPDIDLDSLTEESYYATQGQSQDAYNAHLKAAIESAIEAAVQRGNRDSSADPAEPAQPAQPRQGESQAGRQEAQLEPQAAPSPEGVSVSGNADGTVTITGTDVAKTLQAAGITKTMPTKDGVMVAKSQAEQARDALSARPDTLIALRKRESVLKSLLTCLG